MKDNALVPTLALCKNFSNKYTGRELEANQKAYVGGENIRHANYRSYRPVDESVGALREEDRSLSSSDENACKCEVLPGPKVGSKT